MQMFRLPLSVVSIILLVFTNTCIAASRRSDTSFPSNDASFTIAPASSSFFVHVTSRFNVNQNTPSAFHANSADVLSSAGTYGDFSRYLQTFPGVVFNSDESDDVIVRGGNPIENLYLVDGIEVPDINHITGEGTTGGFTSMLDTSSIQGVSLFSGGYSAQYAERLSSVIDIDTLGHGSTETSHNEAEAGYVGVGGQTWRPLQDGSLLVSVHRSMLNMFTNNIGIDGVPIYTNALVSGSRVLGDRDTFNFLSLSGQDSLNITPCAQNSLESNDIQTQYGAWRTTNGVRWQHGFSNATSGVLTVSDSEQSEHIDQQNQLLDNLTDCDTPTNPFTAAQVYREHTHDGMSILQYAVTSELAPGMELNAGSQARLDRIDYNVAQPIGQQSPYSADPAYSNATTFARDFAAGQSGSWAELTLQLNHAWSVTGGGRLQTFATGGDHLTLTPRLRTSYRLGEHHSAYAAFAEYAQQPSFIYLESFQQNHSLLPIHVQHIILGSELWKSDHVLVRLEAYRKHYWDYPVSSQYAQLSLANMVDTLGQQYVWLPFVSRGHGHNYGAELSTEVRYGRHLFTQASLAYARALYTGGDDVYRPGNFDYPIVGNLMTIWRSPQHWEASVRYEYTSGRPYTPFDMQPSEAQNRPIYNLAQVNAVRGPYYSRLDFQVQRDFHWHRHEIDAFGGLMNTFNRQNFLGNEWLTRCGQWANCVAENGAYTPVAQIGRYPNFGVRAYF